VGKLDIHIRGIYIFVYRAIKNMQYSIKNANKNMSKIFQLAFGTNIIDV
jgi:hypothetical protein